MAQRTLSVTGCLLAALSVAALAAGGGKKPPSAAAPGYRGAGTGGVYPAKGLLQSWPTDGPKLLWKVPLGNSAAPVTVFNDRVYCVAGGDAWLHTFTLDGKPAGKAHLGSASWKRFGYTRSTPLIAEGLAVGTTPDANIYAVDLKTMTTRWKVNAWRDFGSGKGHQGWGLPESPILHGVNVVFNPVSRDDDTPPLVAVDIRDANQIVWEADPGIGKAYSASDCSAALFRHKGRNLIVSPTWCYLLCLDADTGKTLWEIPAVGPKWSTPVYHDGTLLVTIGREMGPDAERQWPAWAALPLDPPYRPSTAPTQPAPVRLRDRMNEVRWSGEQTVLLRLSDDGADAAVQWVRQDAPGRFSHAVFLGGRIYCYGSPNATVERSADGTLPPLEERVGRGGRSALLCLDAATGKLLAQVSAEIPGHVVSADGMLYAVDLVKVANNLDPSARPKQSPRVRLLYPTPKGMEVTGEKVLYAYDEVPELRDVEWEASVPPVIAHGRLFVKFGPLSVFDIRGADYEELPAAPAAKGPPLDAPVRFPTTSLAVVRAADVPGLLAQLGHRLAAHRKTASALLARVEQSAAADTAVRLAEVATTGGAGAWPAQRAAAETLRAMGPSAKAALPALQKALPAAVARRDGTAARLMLGAIRGIDERAAAPAAGPLGKLLGSADPYVQYLAAGLLKRLGPDGGGAGPVLAETMRSGHPRVCREAGEALCAIGPAARDALPTLRTVLLEALQAKRDVPCGLLTAAFGKIDPAGVKPAVPRIAAMLSASDAPLRRLAARTLAQIGPAGERAVDALVAALRSDDEELRKLASGALTRMRAGVPTAAALAGVVAGGQGAARLAAVGSLTDMGSRAAPAVAALVKALGDTDLPLARAAARALGAIGAGAKEAVVPLADALKGKDTELARAAAAALGSIGPDALPAADALRAALKHPDTAVRDNAVAALGRLGRPPVPELLAILQTQSGRLQQWAPGALAGFADQADTVVPALVKALSGGDERLVSAVVGALRTLGPRAAKAAPALLDLARSQDARLASHALSAVGAIGPEAKTAVPALIEIARSKDAQQAASAIGTLSGIGSGAEAAVGPLVELSRGGDRRMADAVGRALSSIKTTNTPPRATDAAATCPEGGSVAIALPATDSDDVPAALAVRITRRPDHGTVERPSDWTPVPTVIYRSTPPFAGADTFTWSVTDRSRDESPPATATVTVTPDTTPPRISEVTMPLGDNRAVIVTFDEPVSPETAERAGNYAIDGGVRVLEARLDESGRAVALKTSPLSAGTYKLTASGIRDRAKAGNRGGGSASFVYRPMAAGLKYAYHERAPQVDWSSRDLAHFDALKAKPTSVGVTAKVGPAVPKPAGGSLLRLDGAIAVPRGADGTDYTAYTFALDSSGSSLLFIDGALVIRGGGRARRQERELTLAAGLHPVVVLLTHAGAAPPALSLTWSAPSLPAQEVPPTALSHPAGP